MNVAAKRLAEIASEVGERRRIVAENLARIGGLEAEAEILRGSIGPAGDLCSLDRTDAIVAVLRDAGRSLKIAEIVQRLEKAGRLTDSARDVNGTLPYLLKREQVQRTGRGMYLAV